MKLETLRSSDLGQVFCEARKSRLHRVWDFVSLLSPQYPGIDHWFHDKVMIGELKGTRRIFAMELGGRLAAVTIAKNEDGERKLCCVRVRPDLEGRGFGIRLMERAMDWMGTDRPLATVSEEKLPQFERIFERYGFQNTGAETGIYRPGKIEYIFNGTLQ